MGIKCLTNSFCISTPYQTKYNGLVDAVEQKEKESEKVIKVTKSNKNKVVDETIIEIMDDDEDEVDFMRDHNTFNHRKKKKSKKIYKVIKSKHEMISIVCMIFNIYQLHVPK